MNTQWQQRRDALEKDHLLRRLRRVNNLPSSLVQTPDGEKIQFCSNDYLALSGDARICNAMTTAMDTTGAGAGASRLVSGNTDLHEAFENAWARWLGFPAAVSFPSGYQANVGAISALCGKGDIIFSDERVHASLIDGCRLSRAQVVVFAHNDMDDLRRRLQDHRAPGCVRLIVTDAIFSMDGDTAHLKEICDIADEDRALVYLDEAHSIGIIGAEGRGLAHREGLMNRIAVHVSTFGKAFGLSGAVVATSDAAADIIRSCARSFLYTTAAPPFLSSGLLAALEIVKEADLLRTKLQQNIARFRSMARARAIAVVDSTTPIQPVIIGDAETAVQASDALWKRGIFVQAIRPPTVAEGTSRLRITITAGHSPEQIGALVEALADLLGTGEKTP